mgnify:CR=1 FL=1
MAMKINSPYTAAITGGGFLLNETLALLPLLQSEDREELLKDERLNNRVLMINAETSRKKAILEISRRYDTMSPAFWQDFLVMTAAEQPIDFHVNVTIRRWNSVAKSVKREDILMEFNEISARDAFVDSWSEATKDKVISAYLSILRKIGILDRTNQLQVLDCTNYPYYLQIGESWFLEACLLQPYQIEKIKNSLA